MIEMKYRGASTDEAKDALSWLSAHVKGFVAFQSLLADANESVFVRFGTLVAKAFGDLGATFSSGGFGINLKWVLEDHPIHMSTALPCLQIMSELLTNSARHAFRDRAGGNVTVSFRKTGSIGEYDEFEINIKDDGAGIGSGWLDSSSLGGKIVTSLVHQINGTIEVNTNGGTFHTVRFRQRLAVGEAWSPLSRRTHGPQYRRFRPFRWSPTQRRIPSSALR